MTWHIEPLPDAELVAVKALRAAGLTASTALPSSPSWPCITIQRIGGEPYAHLAADRARIQINGWGSPTAATGKADASQITRDALAALLRLPGEDITSLGLPAPVTVSDARPDGGISWIPDTTTTPPRPRYVAGVVITLR